MMTKTLIVASVLALSLSACKKNDEAATPATSTPSTAAPATTAPGTGSSPMTPPADGTGATTTTPPATGGATQ